MTLSGKNSRGAGDKSVRSLEVVNNFTAITRFENMNHINEPDSQNNDVEEMETDGGTVYFIDFTYYGSHLFIFN